MSETFAFKEVDHRGQTWRYYERGEGRPVVLLHGFPDTPHGYANIATAIAKAGHRALVPYLRGYHPSTIVDGRGYDAYTIAEDGARFLEALDLKEAVLVGHDWGASVVYGAAVLAPERITAIVPIGIPHPSTLRPSLGALILARHFLYFKTPWAEAGTRRGNYRYIRQLYKRWAPRWRGPERDASIERFKEHCELPGVLHASLGYYRDLDFKPDPRLSEKLAVRGLMIAGLEDFGGHMGPYEKSRKFFTLDADVLAVPKAGHWPHREKEELVTSRLIEFLGSL